MGEALMSLFPTLKRTPKEKARNPAKLEAALRYLERRGLSGEQLARLHPSAPAIRKFSPFAARAWFESQGKLKGPALDFARRIITVADLHRWSEGSFEAYIDRALEQWPIAGAPTRH